MNRPVPHRQRGIGIVTAIFLLVTLAALGVALVSVFSSQQQSSALDVLGARAYLAAKAGAEYQLHRVKIGSTCANASFAMPAGTTLSSFYVVTTCEAVTQLGITRYYVTSTACNTTSCPDANPGSDYVQRVVSVRF